MGIKKIFQQFFWIVSFLLLASVLCMAALEVKNQNSADDGRTDGIRIQMAESSDKDHMPTVMFLHDLHTEALNEKDCSTCHLKDDGGQYTFKFMRTADFDYDVNMTVYHENCIGCHNRMKEEGKQAGPNTGNCRACHNQESDISSSWSDLAFDHSLHSRHVSSETIRPKEKAQKDNCGTCHHEYDKKARKTVYVQGKEGACRYCHLKVDTKEARSNQTVTHESCLNCHMMMKKKKVIKTGPIDCEGCHSAELQKEIKVVKPVPRITRNQPDAVLMATAMNKTIADGKKLQLTISPVAFDHKMHESSTKSCQSCHHASLEKCSACHTPAGDKKGDFITLEKAMHEVKDAQSCVGCHTQAQKKQDCAGCHSQMPFGKSDQGACKSCHNVKLADAKHFPIKPEDQVKLANSVISSRKMPALAYDQKDVPEKVIIDVMKKEYEAAELPHRKVVDTLMARLNKDTLGKYFHKDKYTMCQGCHHNSPMSAAPPKCATCHSLAPKKATDGRPGLKGAYHGQCIGCHDKMGIKKPAATACAECHKKKS